MFNQVAEALQNQNGQQPHSTEECKESLNKKADQIYYLIRQSFDTFQIYGKEPEALENIFSSFYYSLKSYDTNQITNAFQEWMRSSRVMPTPADIIDICEYNKKINTGRSEYSDIGPYQEGAPFKVKNRIAWAYMQFGEVQAKDMLQLVKKHMSDMTPDKAEDYIKYLVRMCGYPKTGFE